MKINFYDPGQENQELAQEFTYHFERILRSGRYVMGPELANWEHQLADYLGVPMAIGLKSGTDALYWALKSLGIGPGDEVITTPFTFPATVEAIILSGARPVLVDIEPETLCLNPELCPEAITEKTKAILLVHLFGNCSDLRRFLTIARENRLHLIEDAAQAIGSEFQGKKLGSLGSCAAFSFYPTKNLGALGNGGALVGKIIKPDCPNSSRLDEIQAAFLSIKLRMLDKWLKRRREIAHRYRNALNGYVRFVESAPQSLSNFHQFAIMTPYRDQLRQFLADNGVETMIYYPQPIHKQPAFAELFSDLHLPVAEQTSREILCLPIRQNLTDEEQEVIIKLITEFFNRL